ncbi:transposase, partial [Caballeronia sordidicola]
YRRRKWLSEPPNGWVKQVLGFRQFSMRGLTKAQAEWKLVCAALNLRRMANMMAA